MTTRSAPPPTATAALFGSLPVGPPVARALDALGYTNPTPIQEQAIPHLRDGRDVLGQAQTGTGKTTAFGIPLLESITRGRRDVQALVLVPTRELCMQVAFELTRLGQYLGVRTVAVYGGVGLGPQIETLARGAQVVVGTPGRVEDLLGRGALRLSAVRLAVLDEADRLLDVGFRPAIERILGATPPTRQTALFSATMPPEVRLLAQRQLHDPVTVAVAPERTTADAIEQRLERVAAGDKLSALRVHLDDPRTEVALIFRRTTHTADRLTRDLDRLGYRVAVLHGRRTQGQRTRVLAQLKAGELKALVATDIAARGLDIAGLTHVVNYDLPDTPETYVHRIGRTGRAGASGVAITLVAPEDSDKWQGVARYLAREKQAESGDARRNQAASAPRRRRGATEAQPSQRAPKGPSGPRGGTTANDEQPRGTGHQRVSDAPAPAGHRSSSTGATRTAAPSTRPTRAAASPVADAPSAPSRRRHRHRRRQPAVA